MRWLVALILILSLATDATACGDCTLPNPFIESITLTDPAKYRIVYTGIEGLIFDEYVRFVSRKWVDDLEIRYNSGAINEFDFNSQIRLLDNYRADYANHQYADRRQYWWHYTEGWGDPAVYHTGPSGDLINIGPIRVNNKFRFKLKDYQTELSNEWSYKFRPIVRISSRPPFIRIIGMGHQFTYRVRGRKVVRITVGLGADLEDEEGIVEIVVQLLNW
jgi:hypothetical protein